MSVTVYLNKVYQPYCDGQETVEVEGKTVKECLLALTGRYPDLEKAIFTDRDKLHPLVEVYLNSSSAYPDPLTKKINDGDKIYLIHTLAGG